jgi:hypothetical protein
MYRIKKTHQLDHKNPISQHASLLVEFCVNTFGCCKFIDIQTTTNACLLHFLKILPKAKIKAQA